MTKLLALAFGALLFVPQISFANCKPFIEKFCKDVKIGQGRVLKCLRTHDAELTDDCKKDLVEQEKFLNMYPKVCWDAYEKVCGKIPADQFMETQACLFREKSKFPAECQKIGLNFMKTAYKKRGQKKLDKTPPPPKTLPPIPAEDFKPIPGKPNVKPGPPKNPPKEEKATPAPATPSAKPSAAPAAGAPPAANPAAAHVPTPALPGAPPVKPGAMPNPVPAQATPAPGTPNAKPAAPVTAPAAPVAKPAATPTPTSTTAPAAPTASPTPTPTPAPVAH